MTVAVAHPSGHSSRANRWLLAAVIGLAGALAALGVWALVHEEAATPTPVATTPLDAGQMKVLITERQAVQNAGDVAGLASFYTADAVFYDEVTGSRFVGGRQIAEELTRFGRESGYLFRADAAPTVIGDRFLIVPFSLLQQEDMDRRTGKTMRVDVLEFKDGKIVREWVPGLY